MPSAPPSDRFISLNLRLWFSWVEVENRCAQRSYNSTHPVCGTHIFWTIGIPRGVQGAASSSGPFVRPSSLPWTFFLACACKIKPFSAAVARTSTQHVALSGSLPQHPAPLLLFFCPIFLCACNFLWLGHSGHGLIIVDLHESFLWYRVYVCVCMCMCVYVCV